MAVREDSPDLEQRVYLERVRIFLHLGYGGQNRAALAFFFAGASLYYADVPSLHIGLWAAACSVDVIALAIVEALCRRADLTHDNVRKWVRARLVLIVLTGLLLGGSAFLLPPTGKETAELMIFVIMVTGVSVTCISYTTMPPYFIGLTLPGMALLILSFLRAPDHIHLTLAVMAVIVEVVLLRKALEVSRTSIQGLRVNEQLKDEVERRHRAEREALVASETAEQASSAKSNFLANVSHELRTPMNAIIGFAGALQTGVAGPINEKQAEYAQHILSSSEHLLALINDLLDLSKIEAGKLEIDPETFSLSEQVERALPMLKKQAEAGGVALATDIPADLPLLHADRRQVGQMIVNLLANAVKFAPDGGRVTIAARNGGGGVSLSVSDDGDGMSEEEIPRALQPFEQTGLGRTKNGTGLGLPLVKRLAELHGGKFTLDSAPGEGTTAMITFPAHRTVDREDRHGVHRRR